MKQVTICKTNRFARALFGLNIDLWKKILMLFGGDPVNFIMREACRKTENHEYSISYRLKPKKSEQIMTYPVKKNYSDLAIVLQGPLRCEDHYTAETVRFYRAMYPGAVIIVSTWDTENKNEIDKISEAKGLVVLSTAPDTPGNLNINYQIVNSRAGIEKAVELGAKYICKTRTDQRICKPHVFDFLLNLLNAFPPQAEGVQDKRLLTLSCNYGNMFYPYFISDFFYFGTANELMRLFSVGMDKRPKLQMPINSTRRDYSEKDFAPEVFLIKNYLSCLGFSCENSVKAYWDAIYRYLICVDIQMIDLDWPKYESHFAEHSASGLYFKDDDCRKLKTANFDFANWFNLYNGVIKYTPEYEAYADVPLN